MAAHARRRTVVSLTAATAVLASLVGGFVRPAAAAPVLAADTERSGAAYAFGRNDFGQTNPASSATTTLGAVQLPAGGTGPLTDAVSVAAGDGVVVWADHLGAVWALGDNSKGQSGSGTTGGVLRTPARATGFGGAGQPKAVKVASYSLAVDVLDDAGNVWQWGQVVNSSSGLSIQNTPAKVPFPSGTTRIVDVAAGSTFSLAMDDAGRVYAWGKNDRGQLGLNSNSTSPYPTRLTGLPALLAGSQAAIDAGREFGAYAVSSSTGVALYTWGRGDSYQLGLGNSTTDQRAPKLAASYPAPAKVLSLSGGGTHGLLLTNDGVVRTWGSNGLAVYKTPTAVPDPAGALTGTHHPYQVTAGDGASFAASTDGTVAAWGTDTTGQLGRATTGTVASPTLVTIPGTYPASAVGIPATISSHMGETYVVVDAQAARSVPGSGYDFGAFSTTPVSGQVAPSKAFTYTNVASRPLTIASLALDGSNPGDFSLSAGTCTGTIAVDGTCSLTVTFRPTAAGARSANVNMRFSNTKGGLPLQSFTTVLGTGYVSVQGLRNFALDLAAGQPTTVSGPGNVIPLKQIPPSLIPGELPPTASAPLGKLPLGKLPLGKLPLGKLPLGKLPLGKLPLGKLPLGKLPLLTQGGWADLLSAYPQLRDVPPDALTLVDLMDPLKNQPDPTITDALPLERVSLADLAVSSSSLAYVSALAVLAGDLRLDQYGGVNWCTDLPRLVNGGTCNDGAGLQRVLLELDLQGVSVDTTRAAAVQVGQLVTDAQSVTPVPFDQTIASVVTLASTALAGTHVGEIPLSAISNLSSIVECDRSKAVSTDCTSLAGRSLDDDDVVAALRPDATFGDIRGALVSQHITMGQLVEPFLDRSSFDWESLPVDRIPAAAYPNRETLQLDVDVNCYQASGLTFGVKLPAGSTYVPGTTVLTKTRGTGTTLLADPTVDPVRGLVVSVPDSSFSSTGDIACPSDSGHVTVRLGVLPTSTAGTYRATGDVRTASLAPLTATQATALSVTGVDQLPTSTPGGPAVGADMLVISRIARAGQVAYLPFDAPARSVVEVTLGNQTADLDSVLYYPVGAELDQVLSGPTPVQVPFGEAGAVEPDAMHPATTLSGGALQDVPLLTDRPVAAVAATRGTDTEQLSAIARTGTAGSTRHVAAVVGYNRAVSGFTWRLRVSDAPALAVCNAPAVPLGATAVSATRSGTALSSADNTAVLVNTSRLIGRYGATDANAALGAASSYVASTADTGVKGQVLQLDSSSAVRDAYAAWDAHPCDPSYANGVVRAVNAFVAANVPTSVTNLVILGGDEQVPHGRLEDHARDGNEREVAGELALNGGNPIASAAAAGYYLSDDPYATRQSVAVLSQVMYLPQVSLGRLGESAADMAAQLTAFVANKGVADPTTGSTTPRTAVATDYDFLTAGGNATTDALRTAGYTVDHTLTGTTAAWTKAQLDSRWLLKSPLPGVAALNMHYDQYRGLPAFGNATGDQSQLYTAQQVSSGPSLERRVVFTVGCHSALDVPNAYAPTSPQAHDFAEAYGGKQLAAMVGNLGFGYADTTAVAYSAQQQALFSEGLSKRYDIGTALAEAKRLYVSRLAGLSAYDLKSAQESILWGLPQYRLSGAAAAQPPTAPMTAGVTDVFSGLTTSTVQAGTSANPLSFPTTATGVVAAQATDPSVSDRAPHTASVPGRPVLPAQYLDVPQVSGLQVRSVLPTGLTSAPVVYNARPPYARPATDHGLAAETQSSGVFPVTLGHVGTLLSTGTTRSTLVVTPAVYDYDTANQLCRTRTDVTCGTAALTTFPSSQWTAFYGPAGAALTPPTFSQVSATHVPATASAPAVTTYDLVVSPAAGRQIKRVYVLATPASGSGAWVRTELRESNGHYVGGALGILGAFYGIAVDDSGAGASTTQKGLGWVPSELPASSSELSHLHVDPSIPASGWFSFTPTVTADAGYTVLVDGVAVANGSTITGDGVHLVQLRRADGSLVPGAVPVLIDTVVPKIYLQTAHASPYELHEPVSYSAVAVYGPSGGPVINATGSVPTTTVGTNQTLSLTATSVAGLTGTSSTPYSVVYGKGSSGFLSPVLAPDGINVVTRLLTYGFSFRLVDYYGAPVTSGAGSGNTVSYASIGCPSNGSKIQLPRLSSATAQPVYSGSDGVWDWDLVVPDPGANVAVCRSMTVTANDGVTAFNAVLQILP